MIFELGYKTSKYYYGECIEFECVYTYLQKAYQGTLATAWFISYRKMYIYFKI